MDAAHASRARHRHAAAALSLQRAGFPLRAHLLSECACLRALRHRAGGHAAGSHHAVTRPVGGRARESASLARCGAQLQLLHHQQHEERPLRQRHAAQRHAAGAVCLPRPRWMRDPRRHAHRSRSRRRGAGESGEDQAPRRAHPLPPQRDARAADAVLFQQRSLLLEHQAKPRLQALLRVPRPVQRLHEVRVLPHAPRFLRDRARSAARPLRNDAAGRHRHHVEGLSARGVDARRLRLVSGTDRALPRQASGRSRRVVSRKQSRAHPLRHRLQLEAGNEHAHLCQSEA